MPQQHNIEKYDFERFEKEQKPFSMILNSVIQTLAPAHPLPYAIWSYLESLPPSWTVNKQHIMKTFNISERTYHTHMKLLVNCNLVQYIRYRNADGTLGVVTIRVLNGTEFNLTETDTHTAKMCIVDADHTAITPQCGEPTMVANCGHINTTTNINKKNNNNKINKSNETSKENKKNTEQKTGAKRKRKISENAPYAETLYQSQDTTTPISQQLAMAENSARHNATPQEIADFETFWDLYPLQSAKSRVQSIWFEQGCHHIANEIIAKLADQIARDKRFLTGHPWSATNYLLNREWESKIFEQQDKKLATTKGRDRTRGNYDRDSTDWVQDIHRPLGGWPQERAAPINNSQRAQKPLSFQELLAMKPPEADF